MDVRLDARTLACIAGMLDERRERGVIRARVDRRSSGSCGSRIADHVVRTPAASAA
jgi:hypothetical protein